MPVGADDLLDLLRAQHALMLERRRPRPEPGLLQGQTEPGRRHDLRPPGSRRRHPVEGTAIYAALPAGLAKAIFMMFLVAEVHPFTDGNGRVGRVLMNAELSAVGAATYRDPDSSYRDDYLQGLRALSRRAVTPSP